MVVCASEEYLARNGESRRPTDLAAHNCLGVASWKKGNEWRFEGSGEAVPVHGTLQADNGEALRMAARNGLGIILQPAVLVAEDVATGRLVPILRDQLAATITSRNVAGIEVLSLR